MPFSFHGRHYEVHLKCNIPFRCSFWLFLQQKDFSAVQNYALGFSRMIMFWSVPYFLIEINLAACTASISISSCTSEYLIPIKNSFYRLLLRTISKPLCCNSSISAAIVLRVLVTPNVCKCLMISVMVLIRIIPKVFKNI